MTKPRVGWLGLGAMGAPMARRLIAAGYPVQTYDPRPPADLDVGNCADPAAAATGVSLLCVMVADATQLDAALFSPVGAARTLDADAVVVVFSTVGPDAVRDAADRLPQPMLDAPVSGGPTRAGNGELVAMTSGPAVAVDAAAALVNRLASTVAHFGNHPGSGQAVKMVNQLLAGVHLAAAAEALVLAERLGLPAEQVLDVVQRGAAGSFMLSDRGPRMLVQPVEPAASAVDIFVKDMGLVLQVSAVVGARTPLAQLAAACFGSVASAGGGRADDSQVVRAYRSPGPRTATRRRTEPQRPPHPRQENA